MRAVIFSVFLAVSLAMPRPGVAEPAQTQPAASAIAAQLAQAAAIEAERLQQAADDMQSTPADSKPPVRDGKEAVESGRRSADSKRDSAKFLEAERLRIRDVYRERQKQRIAAGLSLGTDSADKLTADSAAVSEAD